MCGYDKSVTERETCVSRINRQLRTLSAFFFFRHYYQKYGEKTNQRQRKSWRCCYHSARCLYHYLHFFVSFFFLFFPLFFFLSLSPCWRAALIVNKAVFFCFTDHWHYYPLTSPSFLVFAVSFVFTLPFFFLYLPCWWLPNPFQYQQDWQSTLVKKSDRAKKKKITEITNFFFFFFFFFYARLALSIFAQRCSFLSERDI